MAKLIVKSKRNSKKFYKSKLRASGFKYNPQKKLWIKSLKNNNENYTKEEKYQIKECKKICKKYNLSFFEQDENYTRGNSYRKDYFKAHPHGIFGNYYQCAYCGRFVKKENITIDHLFPINRVEKGRFKGIWRFLLKIKGIKNINQTENLVGACWKCNSEKGTKIKKWYLKGCLGRHFVFWIILWMISLSLFFSVTEMVFKMQLINF